MRIGIFGMHYAPEPSGNAPYTTSLAQGLARRGHAVHVVAGTPHYPEWRVFDGYGRWRSQDREAGVHVTRLRHLVSRRPTVASRSAMEISFGARLVARRLPQVDVAICLSPALLSTAMLASVRRLNSTVPSLLWIQDLYSRGLAEIHGGGTAERASRTIERRMATKFEHVVVAHDRFVDRLLEFGVAPGRIDIIRNWTRMVDVIPPTESLRAEFGWSPGQVICLHAGNMGMKQGLENVVEAGRLADSSGLNLRFVFIGGGHQETGLRDLSSGLPNVDFLGSMPDDQFQRALSAADILLVNERPGVMEMSIPSKLTSYFASGRPVLAAVGRGSVTEGEVLRAEAGLCVASGDHVALVDAAQRIAQDPALARTLGASGRAYALRELSESSALERFESILSELAARRVGA